VAGFTLASVPPLPRTLQRGQSFPVSVRLRSNAEGRHEARVEISSRDLRSGRDATIEAVLSANVVAPDMDVLPAAINFGLVQSGQQEARNVLVSNNGSATLRFRVPPPEPWSFFQWAGDAPMQWRNLASGTADTLTVRYTPAVIGVHRGTISILSEDETVSVQLFGERVPSPQPSIQTVPSRVSFGVVEVGKADTTHLVVANDSAVPLTISAARIEGTDRDLFALQGQPPSDIAAGQAAVLTLTFTPVSHEVDGNRATLVVDSNAANDPRLRVELFGMGVGATPQARWLEQVLTMMMR
jgi:hypothetical protein